MQQPGHALEPLVYKLHRLGDLSQDDIAAIRSLPYHIREVRHLEMLVHEGHAPDHCTLLLSGVAARDRTTRSGGRQLLGLYVKGDLLDLNSALIGGAHDNIQAFGDAKVACIPFDALQTLAFERATVGRLLWVDTLIDASIAREWMVNLGRRDARTRLLHLLCEFATRQEQAGLGGHDELTLPLTQ